MIQRVAPQLVARALLDPCPVRVLLDDKPLVFAAADEQAWHGSAGSLAASVQFDHDPAHDALCWTVTLRNQGSSDLSGIDVVPLVLSFWTENPTVVPRIRHMGGSHHYDGLYPPRAFRLEEEAFVTHDTTKPFAIGGRNSGDHVPLLQFALDKAGVLSGFFVGFEWSGGWNIAAHWERDSFYGEPAPPLVLEGRMSLGPLSLAPGEEAVLPRVHMGFFTGSWCDLDNIQRAYVHERLAAPLGTRVSMPVAYNHWFGIYHDFDLERLKRQANRAAEIGCEYFCLDASWYKNRGSYRDGVGNWYTPDPQKFPRGTTDVKELSAFVRSHGMGFGIWHMIQKAQPDSDLYRKFPDAFRRIVEPRDSLEGIAYSLKLETDEGVQVALDVLRWMIEEWEVSWMRFESAPEDGLAYNLGYDRVIDTLLTEYPNLYVEICNGGGQRLNLGSVTRGHGNWLSDHTINPDVCRFMQTSALRFWPPEYLNLAVTAITGRAAESATAHGAVSRMVGSMSFSGAISEWDQSTTDLMREHVDIYKSIRSHMHQPVYFPLPQPRRLEDWDVVVFGDGTAAKQLLFAFRNLGPDEITMSIPRAAGQWTRATGPDAAAITCPAGDRATDTTTEAVSLRLPKNSSSIWIR